MKTTQAGTTTGWWRVITALGGWPTGTAATPACRSGSGPIVCERLLKRGGIRSFHGRGGRLVCVSGRLWVTDGRSGDLLLGPGDEYAMDARATTVVEALEDSNLLLSS